MFHTRLKMYERLEYAASEMIGHEYAEVYANALICHAPLPVCVPAVCHAIFICCEFVSSVLCGSFAAVVNLE